MCQTTRMPCRRYHKLHYENSIVFHKKYKTFLKIYNMLHIPTSFTQKSKIQLASAHTHIPKNNPAKFHNSSVDSLGQVADKGPLGYI